MSVFILFNSSISLFPKADIISFRVIPFAPLAVKPSI